MWVIQYKDVFTFFLYVDYQTGPKAHLTLNQWQSLVPSNRYNSKQNCATLIVWSNDSFYQLDLDSMPQNEETNKLSSGVHLKTLRGKCHQIYIVHLLLKTCALGEFKKQHLQCYLWVCWWHFLDYLSLNKQDYQYEFGILKVAKGPHQFV